MSKSRRQASVRERDVDITGGDFSDLPGGPWEAAPRANYDGMIVTAWSVRNGLKDQPGVLEFRPFGADVRLTARYLGTRPYGSEAQHCFHFIGGGFELLMILAPDFTGAVIACRGNKKAVQQAAQRVDDACAAARGGLG